MDDPKDSGAAEPVTMQQLRERYQRSQEELDRHAAEHGTKGWKLVDVVTLPRSVNVTENGGNDPKLERATELFYANGRR
jgi:hypothetical protein